MPWSLLFFSLLMAPRRLSARVPRVWRPARCEPHGRHRVPPSPGHPLCGHWPKPHSVWSPTGRTAPAAEHSTQKISEILKHAVGGSPRGVIPTAAGGGLLRLSTPDAGNLNCPRTAPKGSGSSWAAPVEIHAGSDVLCSGVIGRGDRHPVV